jgi:hypothetical protein
MPQDFQGKMGPTKSSRPNAGNANTREVPVFAIVKDNIDPIRTGRLRVYIADLGGTNPDDESCWITVNYMSSFYGKTMPENAGNNPEFKRTPHSYGLWNSPPDIGTTVICIFINGDTNFGYWIGCVPDPEALHMVPAIGSSAYIIGNQKEADSYGGATQLPVTNSPLDPDSDQIYYLDSAKPIHSYQAAILNKQGLIRDTVRGTITTNAQRETPSRVGWGISTPGRPIYEGGFTDANIVNNLNKSDEQLKVIGRRGGHSIIMDDGAITGQDQHIRIRTAEGHQILLSDSGDCIHIIHKNGQSWIEMGKEGTIDMYSTNSVNIRTQGDLNLHADNNININAKKNLNIMAENISLESVKDFNIKSNNNFKGYTVGNFTWKVDGPMSMSSVGEASYSSVAKMFINGSRINLNSGQAGLTPSLIPSITLVSHTDTLYDNNKGFLAAPGALLSIVSRAPAHAPWANANQGVDVKVKLGASEALPTAPAQPVQQVNQAAQTALPAQTVTPTQLATIPNVGTPEAVALTATAAKEAATNPNTSKAVTQGVTVTNNELTVGVLGSSPEELTALATKPQTDVLTKKLISEGKNPLKVMVSNLFTGKAGDNINDFTQSVTNQVKNSNQNFNNSKKQLTESGLVDSNTANVSTAGIIFAGAKEGVGKVIDTIKNVGATGIGSVQTQLSAGVNAITGPTSQLMKNIASANFAAQMQDKLTSGLNGVADSLSSITKKAPGLSDLIEKSKGLASSAFSAISNSIKPFKPNTPQNIKALTMQNTINADIADQVGNISNDIATGLTALPGGEGSVANIVDKVTNTTVANKLPSVTELGNTIKNGATAVMNNISQSVNSAGNMLGNLTSGISQGKNLAKDLLSKLPSDSSSELTTALDSISGNNPTPIKAPTIATDTLETSKAITKQLGDLVGEGVPVPGGLSVETIKSNKELFDEKIKAEKLVDAQLKKINEAQVKYENLKKTLPQGDPAIEIAKTALAALNMDTAYKEALAKIKE